MIILWAIAFLAGLAGATLSSRRAVIAALAACEASNVSLAVMGVTVMAIGTDLPEITNSIVAALTGHGDVAVGDGAGSAMTQVTLIFAVLCIVARPVRAERRNVVLIGGLTVAALTFVAFLARDERLSQVDGLLLIVAWLLALLTIEGSRRAGPAGPVPLHRRALPDAGRAMLWLSGVAVSATLVVRSFVELADAVGAPELIASTIVLALGTSLPELVVDWTALRKGAAALAIGDLFGSSLVDSTLALGSGPAIRSMVVSSGASIACVITAAAVLGATVIGSSQPEHGRRSAAWLIGVYGAATAALITFASS